MRYESEFQKMIFDGHVHVSVNVLYFLPDQKSLLNEFIWSTLDVKPKYPRIKKFLDFWEASIEAKIKQVTICDGPHLGATEWRNGILIGHYL